MDDKICFIIQVSRHAYVGAYVLRSGRAQWHVTRSRHVLTVPRRTTENNDCQLRASQTARQTDVLPGVAGLWLPWQSLIPSLMIDIGWSHKMPGHATALLQRGPVLWGFLHVCHVCNDSQDEQLSDAILANQTTFSINYFLLFPMRLKDTYYAPCT